MSLAQLEHAGVEEPAGPRVTVVIPCFNQGAYLAEALDSVRGQTFSDWECIVVDDGSTDSTAQVGQAYAHRDPRIRYVRQRNGGLSSARNRGLELARAAYVQFLDADDLLHAAKLELQLAALSGAPGNAVCFCDYRFGCGERAATTLERRDFGRPTFKRGSPLQELIDRWESETEYVAFLANAASRYADIDAMGDALTAEERRIGRYTAC